MGLEEKQSDGLSRRSFNLMFCTSLMTTIGLTGMMSVMPAIGRTLHIPDAMISMIFSLSGVLFSVFSPIWAGVSDRYGRKPMMMLGICGSATSMICCAAVVGAGMAGLFTPAMVFAMFLIARGLFGLFGSANMPATQAYIAESTGTASRTRYIASLAGAATLGTVIGPVLAPLLATTPLGLAGPMAGFGVMGVMLLSAVALFLPESQNRPPWVKSDAARMPAGQPAKGRFAGLWRDSRFSPFLIYALAVSICFGAQAQTIGFLVIDKLGFTPMAAQRYIAGAMVAGALTGTFAQWVIVRAFDMKPRSLMIWGAGLAAAGNLLNALQPSYASIVIGYATAAMGFALARPGYSAGASLTLARNEQARAAGALAALVGFNAITNPAFVWLYSVLPWGPFAVSAAAMTAMALYAFMNGSLNGQKRSLSDLESASSQASTSDAARAEVASSAPATA